MYTGKIIDLKHNYGTIAFDSCNHENEWIHMNGESQS